MRSPNVFGIFSLQILRFLAEIYDFEQFSWAPVQDFSKNTLALDRYLYIFSIFRVFHVLIKCWSIVYGALEFLYCFFGDFSIFGRISLILDGSDAPIDDFRRFWAILHPWREQSNTGSDKNECVSIHFRRSVDGACFWPMQHRDSYFLWSFCNEFSTILSTFCIHDVSKATPGMTKMNAIWCIFAGQATACVFDHCNTGVYVFSCSFCGDFRCILASFCMILSTYLEAWSRYMNGPRSRSKRVIFIIFSRVFDTSKIEISVTLAGFPGK